MTHEEALTLLDAYVDGELDVPAVLAFEQHVAACPACATRVQGRLALAGSIRSAGLSYRAPELLRRRIERQVRPRLGNGRGGILKTAVPSALAAGLVLIVGSFYLGNEHGRAGVASAEFASAHTRALLVGHEVDVFSSDHHVVKPWFAGRLPFSPPAPELAASGYQLLGGRVDLVDDRRVAALVYRRGPHVATVFVWPRDRLPLGEVRNATVNGYSVLNGTSGDFDCVFVTDMSAPEAARFRSLWLASAG